jgi:predicted ATPase/DNA-binding CsgD family transcriptional regulator
MSTCRRIGLVEVVASPDRDGIGRGRPAVAGSPSRRPVWAGRRPVPLSTLVGREQEAAALRTMLLRPTARLVTLTGPGGVGKTRLAIDVATDLDVGFDTLVFVPLASVRDPALVPATIAGALGLRSPETIDALRDFFRPRTTLLVLDNVEHVLAAGPAIVDLLVDAPGLTVLATSRALLRISGEQVVTVPPLTLPDPGSLPPMHELDRFAAVRLFVERCQAVRPAFVVDDENAVDVVEICRRLDGLPLAIELAAARVTMLPPRALRARLERRLPLLTRGEHDRPERLRTMRAGIAWSYDLLSEDEQLLFRCLAVFAGACSLAAVESVSAGDAPAALDAVAGLVDKSLLQQVALEGEPRFSMLETIREFAMEQLEASGHEVDARRAHAEHFRRLAEEAESGLRGPRQQEWRDRLEADLDDLRAALAWTLGPSAAPQDAETGLLLVGALWYFWFQRGLTGEARRWLMQALAATASRGRPRAQALLGAGTLAWRQGDCPTARTFLDESAALWRDEGDVRGLAETLHVLGHVRFDQRDYAAARGLFEESSDAYHRADDVIGGLPLVGDLGLVAYHEGDYQSADRILNESLTLYRRHGLKDRVAGALNGLGDLARLAGDDRRAAALYEESLALWRELRGTPGIASALHKLGQVSRATHDDAAARARFVESLTVQLELGNKQGIGECLAGLAATAASDHPVRAAQAFAASSTLLESIGMPLAPVDQLTLERDIDATRRRLGDPAWSQAWAEGAQLSTDEAIRLARLDDVDSDALTSTVASTPNPEPDANPLSRREREVGRLLARGLTNREISRALSISERTVGSHVDHIMTKLGLRSRTRVAVWAIEHGLSRPDADPSASP